MSDSEARSPSDALLDVLVYAPIGLLLDAQAVAPDLARRGRQHSAAARQIGELAVKRGIRRLDEILAQVADGSDGGAGDENQVAGRSESDETAPSPASSSAGPAAFSADALAIPDYDLLAASQVVKRLDALGESELEAVRMYEAGTRDRRTILHKIARLQA